MATACLVGSTGLVGGHILTTLLASPSYAKIHAYTRRDLPSTDSRLSPIKSSDTSSWASSFPKDASIFFSGLGTTKAQAGGFAAQRLIDFDLNLDLAKAAKAAGVKTYVLISSSGSNAKSFIPYSRMKGELEEAVAALGFEHCIIVRPGLIVGARDHVRAAEGAFQKIARTVGSINSGLKDFWAQDAEVIARAAVAAGNKYSAEPGASKPHYIEQADVVRLGKTELKSS